MAINRRLKWNCHQIMFSLFLIVRLHLSIASVWDQRCTSVLLYQLEADARSSHRWSHHQFLYHFPFLIFFDEVLVLMSCKPQGFSWKSQLITSTSKKIKGKCKRKLWCHSFPLSLWKRTDCWPIEDWCPWHASKRLSLSRDGKECKRSG